MNQAMGIALLLGILDELRQSRPACRAAHLKTRLAVSSGRSTEVKIRDDEETLFHRMPL
jgi:hypothetical protein